MALGDSALVAGIDITARDTASAAFEAVAAQADAAAAAVARANEIIASSSASAAKGEDGIAAASDRAALAADGAAASTTRSASALTGHASSLKNNLSTLANWGIGIGVATAAVSYFSVKAGISFDTALAKVHGFAGASSADMAYYRKDILATNVDLGASATAMAQGLYYVVSAGFSGAAAMKVLDESTKAAAASGANEQDVANAVTTALNAYHLSGQQAAATTDTLSKAVVLGKQQWQDLAGALAAPLSVAPKLGASLADVTASEADLTRHGFSAQQAGQDLANTMRGMLAPTREQVQTSQALGVNWQKLYDVGKNGLVPTLEAIYRVGAGSGAPSIMQIEQRTGLPATRALQLFDTLKTGDQRIKALTGSATALQTVLAMSGNQFSMLNQIAKETNNSMGTTERAFKIWQASPAGQVDEFKASLEDLGIALSSGIIPVLRDVDSIVIPMTKDFTTFATDHPQVVEAAVAIGLAFGGIGLAMKGVIALASPYGDALKAGKYVLPVGNTAGWFTNAAAAGAGGAGAGAGLGEMGPALSEIGTEGAATSIALGPVAITLAAVAVAGVVLYEKWQPFRDAVNEMASSGLGKLPTLLQDTSSGFNDLGSGLNAVDIKLSDASKALSEFGDWVTKVRDKANIGPSTPVIGGAGSGFGKIVGALSSVTGINSPSGAAAVAALNVMLPVIAPELYRVLSVAGTHIDAETKQRANAAAILKTVTGVTGVAGHAIATSGTAAETVKKHTDLTNKSLKGGAAQLTFQMQLSNLQSEMTEKVGRFAQALESGKGNIDKLGASAATAVANYQRLNEANQQALSIADQKAGYFGAALADTTTFLTTKTADALGKLTFGIADNNKALDSLSASDIQYLQRQHDLAVANEQAQTQAYLASGRFGDALTARTNYLQSEFAGASAHVVFALLGMTGGLQAATEKEASLARSQYQLSLVTDAANERIYKSAGMYGEALDARTTRLQAGQKELVGFLTYKDLGKTAPVASETHNKHQQAMSDAQQQSQAVHALIQSNTVLQQTQQTGTTVQQAATQAVQVAGAGLKSAMGTNQSYIMGPVQNALITFVQRLNQASATVAAQAAYSAGFASGKNVPMTLASFIATGAGKVAEQCVALADAWLTKLGMQPISGNASAWANPKDPNYQSKAGHKTASGDVLVWTPNGGTSANIGSAGHVDIFERWAKQNGVKGFMTYDANYGKGSNEGAGLPPAQAFHPMSQWAGVEGWINTQAAMAKMPGAAPGQVPANASNPQMEKYWTTFLKASAQYKVPIDVLLDVAKTESSLLTNIGNLGAMGGVHGPGGDGYNTSSPSSIREQIMYAAKKLKGYNYPSWAMDLAMYGPSGSPTGTYPAPYGYGGQGGGGGGHQPGLLPWTSGGAGSPSHMTAMFEQDIKGPLAKSLGTLPPNIAKAVEANKQLYQTTMAQSQAQIQEAAAAGDFYDAMNSLNQLLTIKLGNAVGRVVTDLLTHTGHINRDAKAHAGAAQAVYQYQLKTDYATALVDYKGHDFADALDYMNNRLQLLSKQGLGQVAIAYDKHTKVTHGQVHQAGEAANSTMRLQLATDRATVTIDKAGHDFGGALDAQTQLLSTTAKNAEGQYVFALINHTGHLMKDSAAFDKATVASTRYSTTMATVEAMAQRTSKFANTVINVDKHLGDFTDALAARTNYLSSQVSQAEAQYVLAIVNNTGHLKQHSAAFEKATIASTRVSTVAATVNTMAQQTQPFVNTVIKVDKRLHDFADALAARTNYLDTQVSQADAKYVLDLVNHTGNLHKDSAALEQATVASTRYSTFAAATATMAHNMSPLVNTTINIQKKLGDFGEALQTQTTHLNTDVSNAEAKWVMDLINHTGNLNNDTASLIRASQQQARYTIALQDAQLVEQQMIGNLQTVQELQARILPSQLAGYLQAISLAGGGIISPHVANLYPHVLPGGGKTTPVTTLPGGAGTVAATNAYQTKSINHLTKIVTELQKSNQKLALIVAAEQNAERDLQAMRRSGRTAGHTGAQRLRSGRK